MIAREFQYKNIEGMNQDVIVSSSLAKYAYELKNLRISGRDNQTLLGLETEKGTSKIDFKDDEKIEGTVIGTCVVDNTLVLFTKGTDADYIYLVTKDEEGYTLKLFYKGDLNFNVDHPIETLGYYENSELVKVYWIDGLNPLRMCNIKEELPHDEDFNFDIPNSYFDHNAEIYKGDEIEVTKSTSGGFFLPGSIKYFITYSNKYGNESAIFYISPMLYTTDGNNYGVENDSHTNCSFKIEGNIPEQAGKLFKYVNIYSVLYTDQNSMPSVRVIELVPIINNKISYTDNGTGALVSDPSTLLFKNGNSYAFNTFENKDGILLLGDGKNLTYSKITKEVIEELREAFKDVNNGVFANTDRSIQQKAPSSYYDYISELGKDSYVIKTFKCGEHYRFGIQLMYKDGSWTDPFWIEDKVCDAIIDSNNFTENSPIQLPYYSNIFKKELVDKLSDLGFVKLRPVVVYPDIADRSYIAQGVLNPTIFNPKTRYDGTMYAQASYVFRPNAPEQITDSGDIPESMRDIIIEDSSFSGSYKVRITGGEEQPAIPFDQKDSSFITGIVIEAIKAMMPINIKEFVVVSKDETEPKMFEEINDAIGYIQNKRLETCSLSCLIQQSQTHAAIRIDFDFTNITYESLISGGSPIEFRHMYRLHCPGFSLKGLDEDNKNNLFKDDYNSLLKYKWPFSIEMQTNNYFNKTGVSTMTGDKHEDMVTALDYLNNISKTEMLERTQQYYFVDQSIVTLNSPDIEFNNELEGFNYNGCILKITGFIPITSNFFRSAVELYRTDGQAVPLYLGDNIFKPVVNCNKSAWKTVVSYPMVKDPYNSSASEISFGKDVIIHMFHNTVGVTNSDANVNVKIKTKTFSNWKFAYKNYNFLETNFKEFEDVKVDYYGDDAPVIKTIVTDNDYLPSFSYGGTVNTVSSKLSPYIKTLTGDSRGYYPTTFSGSDKDPRQHTDQSSEAVLLNYKSTPHCVIKLPSLKKTDISGNVYYQQTVLPTINSINSVHDGNHKKMYCLQDAFETTYFTIKQESLNLDNTFGWLWIGELYRDIPKELWFGGEVKKDDGTYDYDVLKRNIWHKANKDYDLDGELTVDWYEGDTYYQRYDCLKTYPYSYEDQNQVIDTLSFMCCSRVNLDGRSDKNMGINNLLFNNPNNFNKLNSGYWANDVLTESRNTYGNNDDTFISEENSILKWSAPKINGATTDTWLHINEFNSLDLDGNYGKLTSLNMFKNEVMAFQENAVSRIKINEGSLKTVEGQIIEFSNTNKVQGYEVLIDKIGCQNKHSIVSTPRHLYWLDTNNKDVYRMPGDNAVYENLSNTKLMSNYFYNNSGIGKWDPSKRLNYASYYDKINEDVFIMKKDKCIAFNERTDTFTSFYDYNEASYFINLENEGLFIKDSVLYKEHAGDYNVFFDDDESRDFEIQLQCHGDDGHLDKTFNTVEFRGDTFDSDNKKEDNVDIVSIYAKTEYQESEVNLDMWSKIERHKKLNKQSLYRMWRVDIPRDEEYEVSTVGRYKHNRIRNPWILLKLTGGSTKMRSVFHDFIIHYTE